MVAFNYSNISTETTLTSGIAPSGTVIALNSTSGLPVSYPFSLILDYGQANVEVVTVTALNGTNFTVTRGEDGTAAQSHNPGARVVHGVVARDLKQSQDHIAASTGVHGAAGNVVGTTDVQTLSNKTINGSVNTFQNVPATALPATFNGGSSFVAAADATVPLAAKGTATATGNLLEAYKGATNQFAVSAGGTVTLAGGIAAGASVGVTRTTASGLVLTGQVTADTQPRFVGWADGTLKWGTGAVATDVSIARTAASTLGVTGSLTVSGTPTNGTDVTTKAYVDARPVGSTVCTSTTRPTAGLVAGLQILETDTGLSYWWTGTAWQRTDWGSAWGSIGGKRWSTGGALANGVGAAEGGINMDTGPITLIPGRSQGFAVRISIAVTDSSSNFFTFRVRKDSTSGAQVGDHVYSDNQTAFGRDFEFTVDMPDIGASPITATYFLTIQRVGGTGTANISRGTGASPTYFLAKDFGPISRVTAA